MCGLVGMVGFLEYKHRQAMKDLLFLDTLRGKDSTGLSAISRERGIRTVKMTVPGYEFIEFPAAQDAMKHADQLWIGHNRFKTRGDVTKANAHPFEVQDEEGYVLLVGAHNGTIDNQHEVERELGGKKFGTDSEAIFHWLTEAPNFKDAINLLRGAWSLVFWDPTTNKVHFCRNKERPMYYAYTKDRKVLVYASEAWMIINACSRNGVELLADKNGIRAHSTLENYLYSLDIPQERDKVLPDLEKEGGYAGKKAKPFRKACDGFWCGAGFYDLPDPLEDTESPEKGKKETPSNRTTNETKQTVFVGEPPATDMNITDLIAFSQAKANGCVWCKDKFHKDKPFMRMFEDALVCLNCVHDRHPKEVVRCEDPLDDEPFPADTKGDSAQGKPKREKLSVVSN